MAESGTGISNSKLILAAVLLILVFGLFIFLRSPATPALPPGASPVPTSTPPSAAASGPDNSLNLLGTFQTPDGVQIQQIALQPDDPQSPHSEDIRFYNPTGKTQTVQIIIRVPKDAAEHASDVQISGVDSSSLTVLQDDPDILATLVLGPSEKLRDIVVKGVKATNQAFQVFLADANAKIKAGDDLDALAAKGQLTQVTSQNPSPSPSPTAQVARLDYFKKPFPLDLTADGYAQNLKKNPSADGTLPLLSASFGALELNEQTVVQVLLYLDQPVSSVQRANVVPDDSSSIFAVSATQPVPIGVPAGQASKEWLFDVSIKIKPGLLKGGQYDADTFQGTITPLVPQLPDTAKRPYAIRITYNGHQKLIHAGLFYDSHATTGYAILLNGFLHSVDVKFCGKSATVPAQTTLVVPMPGVSAKTPSCTVSQNGGLVDLLHFDASPYDNLGLMDLDPHLGIQSDLFCPELQNTFKAIQADFQASLQGSTGADLANWKAATGGFIFSKDYVVRTASVYGCSIPGMFNKIQVGPDAFLPLQDNTLYQLQLRQDLAYPSQFPLVRAVAVHSTDPKLEKALNLPSWQRALSG